MINTWFNDILSNANERLYNDSELERMMLYWGEMPARLRAVEELERSESELAAKLHRDLLSLNRPLYTKRFIQDLLEGLRPLALSVLADDIEIFRQRWLRHVLQIIEATRIEPEHVRHVYELIHDRLTKSLTRNSFDLARIGLEELIESLVQLETKNRE